jgi:hypothetical protein
MDISILQAKIHEVRGQKVILDFDLALLYKVETRVLNQAVKRNLQRFPLDFMFQLTENEYESLRSQIVILKEKDVEGTKNIYHLHLLNKELQC